MVSRTTGSQRGGQKECQPQSIIQQGDVDQNARIGRSLKRMTRNAARTRRLGDTNRATLALASFTINTPKTGARVYPTGSTIAVRSLAGAAVLPPFLTAMLSYGRPVPA